MENKSDQVRPIWAGLLDEDKAGPFLIGGRCGKCGFMTLGIRNTCPECWESGSMSAVPVGRRGELYSYTVLHTVPQGYSEPFAAGYVDIEGGIRVFAHLEMSTSTLRIGAKVSLTAAPLRTDKDGTPLVGPLYKAEPVASGDLA